MSVIEQGLAAPAARVNVWIASGLGMAGVILPIFSTGPQGYWIAPVSLALPPIAFALMLAAPEGFGLTRWGKRSLNIVPALSVMGLIVSATTDTAVLDLKLALVLAGFCAAIAVLLGVGLVGRRLPCPFWVSLLFWAGFGGGYGYGATLFADIRFDHDPAQSFPAQVERQYLSYSRHSTTPHLVLAPWGPETVETDIAVTNTAYEALTPGQTACVTLHPGRLGLAWFQAGVCDAGG